MEPSFVRGICYVYQNSKPFKFCRAAHFFLPLIGDRLSDTPQPIVAPDQMRSLCADRASTVDGLEPTYDVQKVTLAALFEMDTIGILHFGSRRLSAFEDNSETIDVIGDVENPAAMDLWLGILWLKYKELLPGGPPQHVQFLESVIGQTEM